MSNVSVVQFSINEVFFPLFDCLTGFKFSSLGMAFSEVPWRSTGYGIHRIPCVLQNDVELFPEMTYCVKVFNINC